jgi:hypothetical protein
MRNLVGPERGVGLYMCNYASTGLIIQWRDSDMMLLVAAADAKIEQSV